MGRLDGKVCTITGAASGIGREAALLFAEQGAKLGLIDLTDDAGEELAKQIGAAATYIHADVTKPEDVEAMYKATAEAHGGIDVLFNNAGIMPDEDVSVVDEPLEVWDKVIAVNLTGVFLCCRYGIPHLLERGGGSVINTASFVPIATSATSQIAYTASKGGVLALSKELGVEFARQGIRVNAICPGPVRTPLLESLWSASPEAAEKRKVHLPMGRAAEAKEIAYGALFLASDEAGYVNSATFMVDGGLTAAYVTPEGAAPDPKV